VAAAVPVQVGIVVLVFLPGVVEPVQVALPAVVVADVLVLLFFIED
jgi:hypothetical protein